MASCTWQQLAAVVLVCIVSQSSAFMSAPALLNIGQRSALPVSNRQRGMRLSPATPRMLHVDVGLKDEDLEEGGRKVVEVRNKKVVVTRKEGKVYAFNNKCPHLGLSLKRGEITGSDDRHGVCVVCPYHKSKFSLEEEGKCKVWSESILGIKGTEGIGEMISDYVAPMAKSVNPERKKAAPAVTYDAKVEDGDILVDLPPDLSNYAQTRQYLDYQKYKDMPEDAPRRPIDPRR